MTNFLQTYALTLVSLLVIDSVWLLVIAKRLYQTALAHLMSATPNWYAAGLFYLVYVLGLIVFVINPLRGEHLSKIFLYGLLFGFVAYATYDLTNQATMKNWPVLITAIDLVWGALLTGVTSVIVTSLLRWFR